MPESDAMLAAEVPGPHELQAFYNNVELGMLRPGVGRPLLPVPAASLQGPSHHYRPYVKSPPFSPQRPGSSSMASPGKRKRKGQQGYAPA